MGLARNVKGIFVVSAKRTPFGTFGGKLKNLTPTDLQEIATRAALAEGKVKPEWVLSTIVGNVCQASRDAIYISRHVGLRVGAPVTSLALTVNRLCGSGFQSIISACQGLLIGESEVIATGGTENMSMIPHTVHGLRFGLKLGENPMIEDNLWNSLSDPYIGMSMAMTAENLAEKYGITREEADEYALLSHQRWKAAQEAGYFKKEITPVTLKSKKGEEVMNMDEHPKPDSTIEKLSKLPPVFKEGGTVTAGNASGMCDGASSVILATEDACVKYNLKPLARILAYSFSGCDPKMMGIGPVSAIEAITQLTKIKLHEIDLIEVNEAFASQYLAVEKVLRLNRDKTNVNGGAIAMGHPLGASGNRIIGHLVHHLRFRKAKYGLGSACIGGGQGIAILLESC